MTSISVPTHKAPHPGAVAIAFTILFLAGLSFVIALSADTPHFPGPWEPAATLTQYFVGHPDDVRWCAVLQFGSAIPLGIFTATMVSRLRFLGLRVAGVDIALFGGLMASFDLALSALALWVIAYPGIAQDAPALRALYYLVFAVGGVGYSVPLGLLLAGICVSSGVARLLPRWLIVFGLLVAVCGELSWISLLVPKALFLIPATRFPAFVWLIFAGFKLPRGLAGSESASRSPSAL
jgi:hypothetical protein